MGRAVVRQARSGALKLLLPGSPPPGSGRQKRLEGTRQRSCRFFLPDRREAICRRRPGCRSSAKSSLDSSMTLRARSVPTYPASLCPAGSQPTPCRFRPPPIDWKQTRRVAARVWARCSSTSVCRLMDRLQDLMGVQRTRWETGAPEFTPGCSERRAFVSASVSPVERPRAMMSLSESCLRARARM